MILRNKRDGSFVVLSDSMHEVLNAFIDPLKCYYKKDYEIVSCCNETDKRLQKKLREIAEDQS